MAVNIPIYVTRRFDVTSSVADTYQLLVNVPESVRHFPKVDNLVNLGDGIYRWDMQKIGNNQVSIQVVYACKYVPNPQEFSVVWTPVPGVGNSQIKGHWKMQEKAGGGTSIELFTGGDITLQLPKFLSAVAKPIMANEFSGLVDTYIKNLTKTLGAV